MQLLRSECIGQRVVAGDDKWHILEGMHLFARWSPFAKKVSSTICVHVLQTVQVFPKQS